MMSTPHRDEQFEPTGQTGGPSGGAPQAAGRVPLAGWDPDRFDRDAWRDADPDLLPGDLTAELLEDFEQCSRQVNQLYVTLVDMAGVIGSSTDCQRIEGLDGEEFMGLVGQMVGADRYLLQNAAAMLTSLPATGRLFRDGVIGWGVVRSVTKDARSLTLDQRSALDDYIHELVGDPDTDGALHPDELLHHAGVHIEYLKRLRDPHTDEDGDDKSDPPDAASHASFLSRQLTLFGTMKVYGEFNAVDAAIVNNALDAHAGRLPADAKTTPGAHDPATQGRWANPTVSQHLARGLVGLCADALGGVSGTDADGNLVRRPAKPLLTVHIDVDHIVGCATDRTILGLVRTGLRGPAAAIGAATLAALAKNAQVQAVVFDGARPLAATSKVNAADIPVDTRRAVAARDLGDRWPGSDLPVEHCDAHHLRERQDGGDHDPDNLILLARGHHTTAHRWDWDIALSPGDGVVTLQRDKRTFKSLPSGRQTYKPPATDGAACARCGAPRPRDGPDTGSGSPRDGPHDPTYHDGNGNPMPF